MYPSGVGTSYADPRRSNVTKSQSMHFSRGISALKDMSESSANGQNYPTDELGTNLRRGRGLSFTNGIAQFDRFGTGGGLQPGLSRQAEMAPEVPSYDAYMNYHKSTSSHSAANGTYLQGAPVPEGERVQRADDQRRATEYRPSSSSRYSASNRGAFRPTSAPAARGGGAGGGLGPLAATSNGELPAWAKDQVFHPTFDKTVENAKARPGSARVRQQGGLPLSFVPKWISQDKKVLTFEAYFKEAVHESRLEHYRVRRCVVNYFLEDDTIKVSEPREENSGLPQGNFLKRHKVVKEGPGGGFMTWRDLKVPGDLSLYGRVFRVTKCDDFTADFYRERGFQVSSEAAEAVPSDPVRTARSRPTSAHTVVSVGRDGEPQSFHGRMKNDMTDYIEARLGRCQDTKARVTKYLANDRKVLRFYVQWDDRERLYGERRPFVLHFYLEDDTVEVCEVHLPNDGRDQFPKLLRRQKLPLDSRAGLQDIGSAPTRHYTDADFHVGDKVNVFGRIFLIYDCDDFTKHHYATKYGISHFPNLTDRIKTPMVDIPQREVPPPTGFGSDEDSLGSIYNLVPKQPKRDEAKLMEFAGKTLRFLARFESPRAKEDVDRKFIVAFWLADDTVSVFEPPLSNSGIIGGKFLERCEQINVQTGERFTFLDFVVGDTVIVNSFEFRIIDCDKFTQTYIDSKGQVIRSQLYSTSLVDIMKNLQKRYEEAKEQLRSAFHVMDQDHSGNITHAEFIQSLNQLHFDIVLEEAEPLLWWFDPDFKGYISYAEFCDAVVRSDKFPQFLLNWERKKRAGTISGRSSSVLASPAPPGASPQPA
mmetsp:Transcript_27583/g.69988  ORF Transcript_27583/g.69988 Transcript_27583/m.69988 type:complete len:817 (-) Transcript_27583:10-2460(-)